jgi:hypothetical protein
LESKNVDYDLVREEKERNRRVEHTMIKWKKNALRECS